MVPDLTAQIQTGPVRQVQVHNDKVGMFVQEDIKTGGEEIRKHNLISGVLKRDLHQ